MVIVIANTKGGVGKTTIAIHFAHALKLLNENNRIVLLDADTQGSSIEWGESRAESEIQPYIEVQQLNSEKGFKAIIEDKKKFYDFIIIDVGGSDNPHLRRSLINTDIVVVPTSTDPAEISSTKQMITLVEEAKLEYNSNLECFIVFNNVKQNKERKFVAFFKENFPNYIHWVNTFMMTRVAFSRYFLEGKTVFDLTETNEDKKAKEEVMEILQTILGALNE